jgi:hypothetical protein
MKYTAENFVYKATGVSSCEYAWDFCADGNFVSHQISRFKQSNPIPFAVRHRVMAKVEMLRAEVEMLEDRMEL